MIALTPVQVTPPSALPVSITDVKQSARIDASDEDVLVYDLIRAAVSHLDGSSGIVGRCMVTQVWDQSFDGFPSGDTIRLPMPDVTAATVTYRDAAGQTQTLAAQNWRLVSDAAGPMIRLVDGAIWPVTAERPDAVTVRMTLGFGGPEAVPPSLRMAIRVLAAAMNDGREGQVFGSPMFEALIAPWRRVVV